MRYRSTSPKIRKMNINVTMRLAKHNISITSEGKKWELSYKIDEAYRILKANCE